MGYLTYEIASVNIRILFLGCAVLFEFACKKRSERVDDDCGSADEVIACILGG